MILNWIRSASDARTMTYQSAVSLSEQYGFSDVTLVHMVDGFILQNDEGLFLDFSS